MWKLLRKKVSQLGFWDWGMLKIYAFTAGIIVGAFFPEFVKKNIWVFILIVAITLIWLLNSLFFNKRKDL
jgi:hypothetical protein